MKKRILTYMNYIDNILSDTEQNYDYENIIKNNPIHHRTVLFPRDKIIRMAGNSIPVKLLEGIFYQIKMLDEELIENGCAR